MTLQLSYPSPNNLVEKGVGSSLEVMCVLIKKLHAS